MNDNDEVVVTFLIDSEQLAKWITELNLAISNYVENSDDKQAVVRVCKTICTVAGLLMENEKVN